MKNRFPYTPRLLPFILLCCFHPSDLIAQGKKAGAEPAPALKKREQVQVDLFAFSLPANAAISLLYGKQQVANDREMFEKCMELAKNKRIAVVSQARAVNSEPAPSRSKSVRSHSFPVEFTNGVPDISDTREVGTIFEFAGWRDLQTNEILITYAYEHHFGEPIGRQAEVYWKGRREAVEYKDVHTDFYTETIDGKIRFLRPEPVLVGVLRPPAHGDCIPNSGDQVHLIFLKPQFEALPILPKKANHPELKVLSDPDVRVDTIVIEVPADSPALEAPITPQQFADAMSSVEAGKSKLITIASTRTNFRWKALNWAGREFAMLDNVGRRKSTKDVDITVAPSYLGTRFEIAFDMWNLTPAIGLNYSLAYQIAQPAQLPFDLGNENDGKEWHTKKVDYKFGEIRLFDKKQVQSGVPTLIKTVDPTEFRPDGRKAKTRHLVFMVATIIDIPKLPVDK